MSATTSFEDRRHDPESFLELVWEIGSDESKRIEVDKVLDRQPALLEQVDPTELRDAVWDALASSLSSRDLEEAAWLIDRFGVTQKDLQTHPLRSDAEEGIIGAFVYRQDRPAIESVDRISEMIGASAEQRLELVYRGIVRYASIDSGSWFSPEELKTTMDEFSLDEGQQQEVIARILAGHYVWGNLPSDPIEEFDFDGIRALTSLPDTDLKAGQYALRIAFQTGKGKPAEVAKQLQEEFKFSPVDLMNDQNAEFALKYVTDRILQAADDGVGFERSANLIIRDINTLALEQRLQEPDFVQVMQHAKVLFTVSDYDLSRKTNRLTEFEGNWGKMCAFFGVPDPDVSEQTMMVARVVSFVSYSGYEIVEGLRKSNITGEHVRELVRDLVPTDLPPEPFEEVAAALQAFKDIKLRP